MKRVVLPALLMLAGLPAAAPAQTDFITYLITVTGGKHDQHNLPVSVPLTLPQRYGKLTLARLEAPNYKPFGLGQLTAPSILNEAAAVEKGQVRREVHFVVPLLKAGQTLNLFCAVDNLARPQPPQETFVWKDTKGRHADLFFANRPVLRYMYQAYDDSTPDQRNQTYKVFHHLFDPSGQRLVTNGGYTDENITDPKKLLYPHHRGVQFGFSRCSYGPDFQKKADTWGCQKDHQAHAGFLGVEAGPVLGRHRVAVAWHGPEKEVFAKEERELTVYRVPGGTLLEFAARMVPADGPVKLDGDPQHAGFHFRAHNDVAEKTAKQTYYLRPDGQGQPGQTRNWEPKSKKGPADLPWNAMSFVLGDQRYTACYLNHPRNPGEQRYSERDYGRFGCYFVYVLTKERPLVVNYRLWLQEGEITGDAAEALSQAFVAPPKVTARIH